MLTEYLDTKRMLKRNLIAGAVIGAVLVGLCIWLFTAFGADTGDGYMAYMMQKGHSEADAARAASIVIMAVSPVAFLYGLFLPLGFQALNRAKNRMLDGWLVSCLIMIFIQIVFFMLLLTIGSIVGLIYLIYCIGRLMLLKKRMKQSGKTA